MKRVFRITGLAACLLGIFLSVGGHWAVLQSVAWARMIVDFSRTDSLGMAIAKTFDGEHPCAMCLKIRAGRTQEQKSPPVVKWERLPEFVTQLPRAAIPMCLSPVAVGAPFVPNLHADFMLSPPKPPPRLV